MITDSSGDEVTDGSVYVDTEHADGVTIVVDT
jgi:hypothetical protein